MRYKVVYVFLLVLPCIAVASSHQHATNPGYYQFSYGVSDPYTKDHKHQQEEKTGNVVKGSYSLDEPDGTKRVVDYVAGPHKGFQAVVKKIGTAYHPVTYGKYDNNNKYYGNGHRPGYYGKHYPKNYDHQGKYDPKNYDHQGKYDPKNYDNHGKYNPKQTHGNHNHETNTGDSHHPYHYGKYYDENHTGKDHQQGYYGKYNPKNNDNHAKYYGDGHSGSSSYPGFYGHNKGVQDGYKVTQPGKNVKPGFSTDPDHPGHYYHPGYGKYIPYDPVYNNNHGGHHYGHGGSNHHNNNAHYPAYPPANHGNHKGATSYVGTTYWGY